jgi:hypothetical protein
MALLGGLEPLNQRVHEGAGRPAQLYRFRPNKR